MSSGLWTVGGLCGLLMLVLATLGGRVVQHLLTPHPGTPFSSSSFRATLLFLMLGAQGSLLLASLELIAGWNCLALDFILYRVLQLVCPLALVSASLEYYYWRGGREEDVERGRVSERQSLLENQSVLETESLRCVPSSGCGGSRLPGCLWAYLWAVAISVSACALFNLVTGVPVVHSEGLYQRYDLADASYVVDRGQPKAALLYAIDEDPELSEYQQLISAVLSAEKNMSRNHPPLIVQRQADYGWVSVGVSSEVILYCAFFLPLVCYVAVHAWQSRECIKLVTASHSSSPCPPPRTSSLPSPVSDPEVQNNVFRASNNHADHLLQGNGRFQQTVPTDDSGNNKNNHTHAHPLSTNALTEEINSSKTYVSEEDSPPVLIDPSVSTLRVKGTYSKTPPKLPCKSTRTGVLPEAQHLNTKESLDIPIFNIQGNAYSRSLHASEGVNPLKRNTPRSPGPEIVQPADTEGVSVVNGGRGEDCRVCRQVEPYVPLATVVVLLQHVLLVTVLCCWEQGHTLLNPPLPSCVLALPVYCALLFTFLGVLP